MRAGQRSRITEDRLNEIEEMLCAGISPGRVEHLAATRFGISPRQARRLRMKVYDRWKMQSQTDAPHQREKYIRMGERFFAKCVAREQFTAAAQMFGHLARMSGGFVQHDPARDARVQQLGPPPEDPTQALVWGQRCLMLQIDEVTRSAVIDPERKIRLVGDLVAKLGMTHAKVLVESRLAELGRRLLPTTSTATEDDLEEIEDLAWPDTARAGRRDGGDGALSGHGAGAPAPPDGGDPARGRGPVGPH
jgi:hypothetical protein